MRIVHLSDIHIQDRRRAEYKDVFAALHESVRRDDETQPITAIVIAGDTFDTMTKASANNWADVAGLLENLADIAPVVLMPGNHDLNVYAKGAPDLIAPMLEAAGGARRLQPPRVVYWRHSGVYSHLGAVWCVGAPDEPIPAAELVEAELSASPPDTPLLGLFHESVQGARFPNGVTAETERLTPARFEELAGVAARNGGRPLAIFLGDIHLRQRVPFGVPGADLGLGDWRPKPVAEAWYPGSLVAQNFGEGHPGHGYLLWSLGPDSIRVEKRDVPNPCAFLTVELRAGRDVTPVPRPETPSAVRLVHDAETTPEQVAEWTEKLETLYGKPLRSVTRRAVVADGGGTTLAAEPGGLERATAAAADWSQHERLVRDEILGDEAPELVDRVIAEHREKVGSQLGDQVAGAQIRLNRLEFDNLFCYGEGNVVDFTELEGGLGGVIAPNRAGKSSLLDILIFALYDVVPRGTKQTVVNLARKNYHLELQFEIDGTPGRLIKSGTYWQKAITRIQVFFGDEELTGKSVPDTVALLRTMFGEWGDAAVTAFARPADVSGVRGFAAQTPAERRTTLARLLKLGVYSQLGKDADREARELRAALRTLLSGTAADTAALSGLREGALADVERLGRDAEEAGLEAEGFEYDIPSLTDARIAAERTVTELEQTILGAEIDPNASEITVGKIEGLIARCTEALGGESGDSIESLEGLASDAEKIHFATLATQNTLKESGSADDLRRAIETLDRQLQQTGTRGAPPRTERPADTEIDRAREACVEAGPAARAAEAATLAIRALDRAPAPTDEEALKNYETSLGAVQEELTAYRPHLDPELREYFEVRLREARTEKDELIAAGLEIRAGLDEAPAPPGDDQALKFAGAFRSKYGIEDLPTAPDPENLRAGSLLKFYELHAQRARILHGQQVAVATKNHELLEALESRLCQETCDGCAATYEALGGGAGKKIEILRRTAHFFASKALEIADKGSAAADARVVRLMRVIDAARRVVRFEVAAAERTRLEQDVETTGAGAEAARDAEQRDRETRDRVDAWARWDKSGVFRQKIDNARKRLDQRAKADEAVQRAADKLGEINALLTRARRRETLKERGDTLRMALVSARKLSGSRRARAAAKAELAAAGDGAQTARASMKAFEIEAARAEERGRSLESLEVKAVKAEDRLRIVLAYRTVLNPKTGLGAKLLELARGGVEAQINAVLERADASFRIELGAEFDLLLRDLGVKSPRVLPAVMGSGYQQFVLELACRVALLDIAQVPLPACLLVDEGFGCLDEENLPRVAAVLKQIATPTAPPPPAVALPDDDGVVEPPVTNHSRINRCVLAITHIEALKPFLDFQVSIDVDPTTGHSLVVIGEVEPRPDAPDAVAIDVAADAAPLAAIENKPGQVWCEVCQKAIKAGWGDRHMASAIHQKNIDRNAARDAGSEYCEPCDKHIRATHWGRHIKSEGHQKLANVK